MSTTASEGHVGRFSDEDGTVVDVYAEGGDYVGRCRDGSRKYDLQQSEYEESVYVASNAETEDGELVVLTPVGEDDDGYYSRSQPVPWLVRWLGGLE